LDVFGVFLERFELKSKKYENIFLNILGERGVQICEHLAKRAFLFKFYEKDIFSTLFYFISDFFNF